MAEISLDSVRKEFGDLVAVEDIDLTVEDGEFFCLLGPSGCGKTTTLRMIAGLESQTSGKIFIGGDNVTDTKPKERDLAMVFQSHAVYPHLDVFENLAFPLRAERIDDEEIDRRVNEVAATLDIEDKLQQGTADLSGGQRQRVALGRAIIRSPRAFLMDEPLSSLDANLRRQMRIEITDLQSDLEATVVYVTHDQVEAMTMADRIALLRDGQVEQVGPPSEVYDNPANTWVGDFLGNPGMNFLEASVENGGLVVADGGGRLPLPETAAPAIPEGATDLELGVRPENVVVGVENGIEAEVVASENVGDSTILHLESGSETYQAKTESKRNRSNRGDTVAVGFDERLHVFDGNGDILTRLTEGSPWKPGPATAMEG